MYISPIARIYGDIETQILQDDEKFILKAVREAGINVVLWQYTSTGHVDGIGTNVDMSKGANE